MAAMSNPAGGRNEAGKSVFKSFVIDQGREHRLETGMGDVMERGAPGIHTSDTIDYGIMVRSKMTLELDDGEKVHLKQGDCSVQ